MAFKMKNSGGAFKMMGSSPSPMKATGYVKPGGKATGNMKDYAMNSQERADEYDARGWAQDDTTKVSDKAQARTDAADAGPTTTFTGDRDGKRTETTKDATGSSTGKGKTVETDYSKRGKLKETRTSENLSTWDPETQTGKSGLGVVDTVQKTKLLNRDKDRRRSVSVGDMGTDDTSDDTKIIKKRGIRNNKTKMKTEKGTLKTKTNRKTGETKTKVRVKGELFGKTAEQRAKKSIKRQNKQLKRAQRKGGGVKADPQADPQATESVASKLGEIAGRAR